jgi:hypothetical protein
MAEAIAAVGVVASVAQLADYGFRLSIKLISYSEAVSRADKTIESLSNEVSFTSGVLKVLGDILEHDDAKLINRTAVEATQGTVKECFVVFEGLTKILDKALPKNADEKGARGGKGMKFRERMKWPFMEPKVELMRANLDRLKMNLTLMLEVLKFARDITSQSVHYVARLPR